MKFKTLFSGYPVGSYPIKDDLHPNSNNSYPPSVGSYQLDLPNPLVDSYLYHIDVSQDVIFINQLQNIPTFVSTTLGCENIEIFSFFTREQKVATLGNS